VCSSDLFVDNKTQVTIMGNSNPNNEFYTGRTSANVIAVTTRLSGSPFDSILTDTVIEIKVFH